MKSSAVPTTSSMDEKEGQLSLEDGSSWVGFIFLTYLGKLLRVGNMKTLEPEDLGVLSKQDDSRLLHSKFIVHYAAERMKPIEKRSLWHVLWLTIGYKKLLVAILLFCFQAVLIFGPVMILNRLVKSFAGVNVLKRWEEWLLVSLLFVLPVIGSVALAHSNNMMIHIGIQAKNALIGVIYRKSLVVSPYKKQEISTGRIITMFSDDTTQIRNFLSFANNVIVAPLQIAACLYLIYKQVGVATFVALGFSVVTVPLSGVIFGIVFKLRAQKMKFTDARVKLMNEVLNGIRIIKYYTWETAFVEKIEKLREQETSILEKMGLVFNSAFAFLMIGAPQLQIVLVYFTYVSLGNQLDAATAFTALSYFGIMTGPFIFLPYGAQQYNQSKVAMGRIMEFLDADELESYISHDKLPPAAESKRDVIIKFEKANMSWLPAAEAERLAKEAVEKSNAAASAAASASTGGSYDVVPTTDDAQTNDVESNVDANITTGDSAKAVSFANHSDVTVSIEDAAVTAEQGPNKATETLRNINIEIKRGQLVAIVGTVGCGKSSLLAAILGEMYMLDGAVSIAKMPNGEKASIAFCDQRPWIINASVRDNILFGKEFDQERFDKALLAACMTDDLKILPAHVDTEIGERGINLSGGQKARISLARAVYNDADIVLLDDPLSAVDAHVGEHLLSQCIKGSLAGKTRLLVTHHLPALPQCDLIVILDDDGTILTSGTYDEIVSSGIDVEKYLVVPEEKEEEGGDGEVGAAEHRSRVNTEASVHSVGNNTAGASAGTLSLANPSGGAARARARTRSGSESVVATPGSAGGSKPTTPRSSNRGRTKSEQQAIEDKNVQDGKTLMSIEERNDGVVSTQAIFEYFIIGGLAVIGSAVLAMACCHAMQVGANFWLIDWGEETTIDNYFKGKDMSMSRNYYYMKYYALLQVGSVLLGGVARVVLIRHRSNASIRYHHKLLRRVLYYPVSFFDVTPIGRVINRFSQDMQVLDEDLASSIGQLLGMGGSIVGSLAAIAASSKGTFAILFIPLAYFYNKFQRYFQRSNIAIARIEAVSRSPIYADFSQTLSGTSTVRAYGQELSFTNKLDHLVNTNAISGVLGQVAAQWLGIRLDFLGSLVMLFMGILAVASQSKNDPEDSFIPAGYLALGLTYSISLTGMLKMTVRTVSVMENQFNSVERFRHYIHKIAIEGEELPGEDDDDDEDKDRNKEAKNSSAALALTSPAGDGDIELGQVAQTEVATKYNNNKKRKQNLRPAPVSPPASWPEHGSIEFRNVSMKYRNGPPVLKGVSFKVGSEDKIGICGRTGCGKSSLMVALFRIEEVFDGQILIDDIDIATMTVKELRRKLCIIPQDPVMFSATVRFNLDPFNEATDDEVWEVLEGVNMKAHVLSLPNRLEEMVAEGGDNFSAGQRQLICIGRAILRKPRILVMDEATASIDRETDVNIQSMIRNKFKHCTVLTIAHRLHTIIDSTKILVMDKGLAAEFEPPQDLLAKKNGLFAGLWAQHVADGGAVLAQKSIRATTAGGTNGNYSPLMVDASALPEEGEEDA